MSRQGNIQKILPSLRDILGDRLSVAQAVREHHGTSLTHLAPALPEAVAFVNTTEEVSRLVKLCHEADVPVIAFGTGTSLEGHFLALEGGLCIDLSGMNRIVSIHAEDLDATVEAGVTREELNHALRDQGLFFPIDPGANASLGGMTSTRASGTNAVRYGTMRDNVRALTAVMADGQIIRTSSRAKKSAAGYDLNALLTGAEGTLGIITEITLRLYGIPEAMSAAVCHFDNLESAVKTVVETIQVGIPVARIELVDPLQMELINDYAKLDYAAKPTLFLEFHGSTQSVQEQAELFGDIAAGHGSSNFRWATRTEDRNKLWKARHDAFYAVQARYPGKDFWATDVCVPISRLTECVLDTYRDIEETGIIAPLVGHVGDGNFHLTLVFDKQDPEDVKMIESFNDRLVERALRLEGTSTGEHGVGIGKKKFMPLEHGPALDYMQAIKRAFDPKNILNPGKIVDLEDE
ncbi:FAD-binding oxidoreductase [Emcibacter nanhaiensis]|uniref:D-lactate dehydrogenase (cytochrome) n=1 Tax=Emcibacter nanhaiensis TaxID=1505037 RepID=A0A501PLZ7_9PROT|nr:FAD-linked oxidase C-terminal domain-containing protein [Emcibacter nanhaiensis]TPD61530.1 FAD-binding protein [Emcibacter nanhaiensis]